MRFFSFHYFLPKVIHSTFSSINGEIKVVEQFGKRTIMVGGLQQSGDLVEMVWEKGIKTVTNYPPSGEAGELKVKRVLILGVAGGSAVKVLNKYFPKAKIFAIEIDPAMVEIGKKYFNLKANKNLTIKVTDAFTFVKKAKKECFDLILIDLYIGKSTPAFLEAGEFLYAVKKILAPKGFVIINSLRGKGKEKEFTNFYHRLQHYFRDVKTIKPLINTLFICQK